MSQATPEKASDPGPTNCVNCGKKIRRFGQTRRWCHDQTGNVECGPTERIVFGHVRIITGLELDSRIGRGVMLERITRRLEHELGKAVDARGGLFSEQRVRFEIKATYTADVPKVDGGED
jgi:hypothetical protein